MRLPKYFIFTIIVMMMNSCTFYSLKGTMPIHIKNIYISPIINKSMDQEVVDLLDDKLNQLTIDQNVLEVVSYDTADSKLDIIVTEVVDIPYTLSQGDQFEKVDEWKFIIKANVVWSDFHKGEVLFNINITAGALLFTIKESSHSHIELNNEETCKFLSPLFPLSVLNSKFEYG